MPDKVITVKLLAQSGQYSTAMAAAAKSTQGFAASVAQSANNSSKSVSSFAKTAATFGKVVTIGVAGGLALSAKAALDFESSFTGVRKTLDATPGQFARLRDQIRGLAKDIPISVNELNRIAELGGQLGVSVGGIEEFTDTIAKLGVTTNLESGSAAQSLARLREILGFSEQDFERFASSLVDLGNNFATTEDQILTFALRIAPVGATIGLTADQVLGLATAFSSVGVPAERGGTAIQRTFIAMAEAVATGADNLDTFGKVAGKTGPEFAALFEEDAAQALDEFLAGLDTIDESGGNVFAVLDELGLGSQRTVQALLAMSNAEGLLTTALNTSEGAWRDNLALQAEADLRFETTASKIAIAKNQIYDLGISIGEGLLPVLGAGAERLGDFIAGIDALGPASKGALAIILGLTAGLVTFNKVGKSIISAFGIELPKALAASTVKATALRAALGVGLIGALTGVVYLISEVGREARESDQRVRNFTEALDAIAHGDVGTPVEAIIGQLSEADKAALDGIGISYNVFAEAVLGSNEALKIWGDTISGLPIDDLGLIINEQAAPAIQLLQRYTDDYNESLIRSRDILDQEGLLADMKAQALGYENAAEYNKELALQLAGTNRGLGDQAGAFADAEEEAQAYVDALAEIDDQLDNSYSFVDAVQALAEAMAEVEAESDPTFDQLIAITEAMNDVERAARELGPDGIAPMLENLERARQMGLLTEDQYRQLLETLLLIDPVAQTFSQGSSIITANLGNLASVASETGVPISGLIQLLVGLNAAMAATITNAEQMSIALDLAINQQGKLKVLNQLPGEDAASQLGGVPLSTVNEIKRRFDQLSGAFIDIGSDIADSIGAGIKGGGGGGGVADAVEEELEDAIDVARQQLDALIGAIDATLGKQDALWDFIDAETELRNLRLEAANLPDKIRAAEERLAKARADARATTLDELLAIQIAEEDLARARLAYTQGRISETELKIAERDLADARSAATADTDEVADAEEELQDLRDRELEVAEDLVSAERDLLESKLDLIAADLDLVEAGRDYLEVGQEGIDTFAKWASQIGLTIDQIEDLLALAGTAGRVSNNLLGSGSGLFGGADTVTAPTSTTSSQYVVKSGDTLSAIAQTLGVTLAHLIAKNPDVFNQSTNTTRTLDPNVLFPGDVLSFGFGGVVPGPLGKPQLAIVHGGEGFNSVTDTRRMRSLQREQTIQIQNLYVNGVFDPTRPGEWQKIMQAVRDDFEFDRRSRTVY